MDTRISRKHSLDLLNGADTGIASGGQGLKTAGLASSIGGAHAVGGLLYAAGKYKQFQGKLGRNRMLRRRIAKFNQTPEGVKTKRRIEQLLTSGKETRSP